MRIKNFTKKLTLLCTFVITATVTYSQVPEWELADPKYPTADAFVVAINIMDHGADPTGETDQTKLIQDLLDILGSRSNGRVNDANGNKIGAQANRNGGVLYLPEGKYLIKGTVILPKGVTIRGDWEKPVKGQPIKGTIIVADNPDAKGRDCTLFNGFPNTAAERISTFILQPSSAVRDLNIWYPKQDPNNIVAYPPAILFGQQGFWGNDYTLASNITLVNAFDGIIFSRNAGGGAPNCYGIYGTPLRRGIEIDNIAEVGRIDNVDFSPNYWAGSGLPGSPSLNGPHKQYIRDNGTVVVMRRNDWSFIGKVKAEGYNTGYLLGWSYNKDREPDGNYTAPNGHNWGMEFTDCKYGVYVETVAGAGMMFYEYKFINCDYGFYLNNIPKGNNVSRGILQIQGCEFDTKIASLYAPLTNNTKLLLNQNTINKGPVDIRGGLASIVNCDFNNEPNQIVLGANVRAIVTGNRFKEEPDIKCVSIYECIIDHTPIEMTALPHFPYKNQYDFVQKPSGNAFYVADASNGVIANATFKATDEELEIDNAPALQALLDKVKAEGGGVVFLPPGRYNFHTPIVIPTGVELKGSVDTPTLPTGPGSVMEIYAGKGEDEAGTPFISMEPGSGIRGLVMNYPEQKIQLLTDQALNDGDIFHYPYTIRGNRDVYIVNIAFRTCYHGLDLFTNKCDNHFVDYLAGHVFKTGIRVGGGSKGGHIYNSQFNQIAYGSGGETKYGGWPNSPDNEVSDNAKYTREHSAAYAYCWNNLNFIILENCEDQVMFNNFDFGSNRGFTLAAGANGISLGQGIDQGMNAFYLDGVGEEGFNFINSQIVTTAPNPGNLNLVQYLNNNRYIQTTANLTGRVTFFGADFWGQPQNISNEVLGGTLEMQAGNYDNPGGGSFGSVSLDGTFEIFGSNINNTNSLLKTGSAPQFFIQSSMTNQGNVNPEDCGLWLNNLGFTARATPDACAFTDRNGWIATASVYNADAQNTLDGNTSTRWSTLGERQKPGQWFMVDMLVPQTFTGIYLDAGSAGNQPSSVKILISSDNENWTQIASGSNFTQATFDEQTARYIRVEQTANSTAAWRISEFYVMNTYLPNPTSSKTISVCKDVAIWFSYDQLNISGLIGVSTVKIYNLAGQMVAPVLSINESTFINLPSGIYVVVIQNNGNIYQKKLIKN